MCKVRKNHLETTRGRCWRKKKILRNEILASTILSQTPLGWMKVILEQQWEEMMYLLKQYKEREHHCNVPLTHIEDDMMLGRWLERQRWLHMQGNLDHEHQARLEEMGIFVKVPVDGKEELQQPRLQTKGILDYHHINSFARVTGEDEVELRQPSLQKQAISGHQHIDTCPPWTQEDVELGQPLLLQKEEISNQQRIRSFTQVTDKNIEELGQPRLQKQASSGHQHIDTCPPLTQEDVELGQVPLLQKQEISDQQCIDSFTQVTDEDDEELGQLRLKKQGILDHRRIGCFTQDTKENEEELQPPRLHKQGFSDHQCKEQPQALRSSAHVTDDDEEESHVEKEESEELYTRTEMQNKGNNSRKVRLSSTIVEVESPNGINKEEEVKGGKNKETKNRSEKTQYEKENNNHDQNSKRKSIHWPTDNHSKQRTKRARKESNEKHYHAKPCSGTDEAVPWKNMFSLMTKFKQREGHCRVSLHHEEKGTKLGLWLSRQRSKYHSGDLDPKRLHLLEEIGCCVRWTNYAEQWDEMFRTLARLKDREGHCNISKIYKENGLALGAWLHHQRMRLRLGKMDPQRRKRLEMLGVIVPAIQRSRRNASGQKSMSARSA